MEKGSFHLSSFRFFPVCMENEFSIERLMETRYNVLAHHFMEMKTQKPFGS